MKKKQMSSCERELPPTLSFFVSHSCSFCHHHFKGYFLFLQLFPPFFFGLFYTLFSRKVQQRTDMQEPEILSLATIISGQHSSNQLHMTQGQRTKDNTPTTKLPKNHKKEDKARKNNKKEGRRKQIEYKLRSSKDLAAKFTI